MSLASVVVVSLVSLVGLLTLSLDAQRVRRLAMGLVSFAVGGLLGDAFIHLLPESFGGEETSLRPSLLVLGGLLLFFVVEKLVRHAHRTRHIHAPAHAHQVTHPELLAMNLIGDGIHNFIDGVLIGASYLVSPTLGISTTVAVLLHEIPQELGDFGILLHSGLSIRMAALLNLASASLAVLGTLAVFVAGNTLGQAVPQLLVPLTAGGFVYIAAANLIPELQHDRTVRGLLVQSSLIALGILVMSALKRFE
jgi:zinc and cadmium transporter